MALYFDPGDIQALVDLYHATNGPGWTIPWDLSKCPSSWQGIKSCEGRIMYVLFACLTRPPGMPLSFLMNVLF